MGENSRGTSGPVHRSSCRCPCCETKASAVSTKDPKTCREAQARTLDPESPEDSGGSTGSIHRSCCRCASGETAPGPIRSENPEDSGGSTGSVYRSCCRCASGQAETCSI